MYTEALNYYDGDTKCVGFIAYGDSTNEKRPVIVIVHAFEGAMS